MISAEVGVVDPDLAGVEALGEACTELGEDAPALAGLADGVDGLLHAEDAAVGADGRAVLGPGAGVGHDGVRELRGVGVEAVDDGEEVEALERLDYVRARASAGCR